MMDGGCDFKDIVKEIQNESKNNKKNDLHQRSTDIGYHPICSHKGAP
jgi:hypothetical protein